ncbi:MAG: hypothetical protein KIT56_10275 [Gammaproteobacteria bacterium]|nr:hypothetical protein [Gammaproteobacteria bacterium]MCW5584235.1 hypothetical protein [Gammaproteobacteria bacterium]
MDSRKTVTIRTNVLSNGHNGEVCDTLFYQGNGCSQTQALKYVGNHMMIATTGEIMWCTGRNNLQPLNVIYRLYIGKEIADVNLHPFDSYFSLLNPIKIIGSAIAWVSNWRNGFHFIPTRAGAESVVFHAPIFSQVSIGQETDMLSHRKKYDAWLKDDNTTDGLILWGVSRGTAATFCAFAKEKYPEVKLVVLEGAIDSVQEVLPKRVLNTFKSEYISRHVTNIINTGLTFFNKCNLMQYHQDGPSPLKSVAEFPEGIPVVFITSKVDTVVTCDNTENIARALAEKGKNDVYLLKLERSSHPNYMFDNIKDRDCYEAFIHAIYKKYNLEHDHELARKGEHLISSCTLCEVKSKSHYLKKAV